MEDENAELKREAARLREQLAEAQFTIDAQADTIADLAEAVPTTEVNAADPIGMMQVVARLTEMREVLVAPRKRVETSDTPDLANPLRCGRKRLGHGA